VQQDRRPLKIGDHVLVHLAVHCDEPETEEVGIVDYVYPGGQAFSVQFPGLRTEVVALYEIKRVVKQSG
jgi:hypothetical protein